MIDFHVHVGDFYRLRDDIQALLVKRPLEAGWNVGVLFSNPGELERYLSSHGVRRAVLLAECGPGTNFTIDSEMIARMAKTSPFFVPFGSINPNCHDARKEFEKSIELGIRGFKFYPADHGFDPYMEPMMWVYARCEELKLPVLFHTGSTAQRDASQRFTRPEEFESIACTYPDLTMILAHAGKPNGFQSAKNLVLRYDHVYVDTALVDPEVLVDEYGDMSDVGHKILFGSDWPVVGSYTNLINKLRTAKIDTAVLEGILHRNAERVLARAGISLQ